MKKAMKCMAGILALTLAFAQVAPVSAFAEETTAATARSEEHTSELQSPTNLV